MPLVAPVNSKAFPEISICSNKSKKNAVPKTSGEIQIILKDPTSNNVLRTFCFSSTISTQRNKEIVKFIKVAISATISEFMAGRTKSILGMAIFSNPLKPIIRIGKKINIQKSWLILNHPHLERT